MERTNKPRAVAGGRNWHAVNAHLRSGAGPIGKQGRRRRKALRQAAGRVMRAELDEYRSSGSGG